MVLVHYIFQRAFQQNQGGYAAAVAVALFVLVVVVSVLQFQLLRLAGRTAPMTRRDCRPTLELLGRGSSPLLTVVCAVIWAFPLYWGVISSLKPEDEVIRPYIELWPETLTFQHYIYALTTTQIGAWYLNSVVVAVGVTVIMRRSSAMLCGYAISQLRFPGRTALWWLILA